MSVLTDSNTIERLTALQP